MNEIIFFLQIVAISSFLLIALTLGKEALISIICLCGILANIFVLKQIDLFGLTVTASDAYMVGCILGLNLLQEYYGKDITRRAIITNFMLLIFYLLLASIHLAFIPSSYDNSHLHFVALLAPMPRIILASFTSYFTVQYIDYYFYGFLKWLCNNKWLIARNVLSLCLSQGIDTVLFSFLGLYGMVNSLRSVILFSFAIKVIVISCTAPCIWLSKKIQPTPRLP
jgi:uncharacterized integral membrane protein (TIGR00697 family)